MSTRMSDDEARAVAARILASEGRLTVRRAAEEIEGDTGWVSRIVREAKAGRPKVQPDPAPADTPADALPPKLREITSQLEREILNEISRVVSDGARRARLAEQALRSEHERIEEELRQDALEAQSQLGELEEVVTELTRELTSLRKQAGRADELEGALEEERLRHDAAQRQWATELAAAQSAALQAAEEHHHAKITTAEAEAEVRSTRESLVSEREERHRVENRCSALQADRDQLHHDLSRANERLEAIRRDLEVERAASLRLEQLLAGRLSVTSAEPEGEAIAGKRKRTSLPSEPK